MWSQLMIIDFLLGFGLWISFIPLSTNSPWMKKELPSTNPIFKKEHLNENKLFIPVTIILEQLLLPPFWGPGSQ